MKCLICEQKVYRYGTDGYYFVYQPKADKSDKSHNLRKKLIGMLHSYCVQKARTRIRKYTHI